MVDRINKNRINKNKKQGKRKNGRTYLKKIETYLKNNNYFSKF